MVSNERKCRTCAFVEYIDAREFMRAPRNQEFWNCTYRPPATMREFYISLDGLTVTANLYDVRVEPDDWCSEWRP